MKLAACQLAVAECRPVLVFLEDRQHLHRMYTRFPLRLLMDGMAVGLHSDIEVTCSNWGQVDRSNPDQRVTQVCCEIMSMSRAGALN